MYTQNAAGRLVVVDQPVGDSLDWPPGGSGLVSTAGDYWWSGFYGTTFFVSPATGLVGVVLSQNQPGPYSPTPYAVYIAQGLAFLGL